MSFSQFFVLNLLFSGSIAFSWLCFLYAATPQTRAKPGRLLPPYSPETEAYWIDVNKKLGEIKAETISTEQFVWLLTPTTKEE